MTHENSHPITFFNIKGPFYKDFFPFFDPTIGLACPSAWKGFVPKPLYKRLFTNGRRACYWHGQLLNISQLNTTKDAHYRRGKVIYQGKDSIDVLHANCTQLGINYCIFSLGKSFVN